MNKEEFFSWSLKPIPYTFDGHQVFLKQWSLRTKEEFGSWCKGKEKEEQGLDVYARVAVNTVCDESGKLIFTMDDVPRLMTETPGKSLEALANACIDLNKSGVKAVEEVAKNSQAIPNGTSIAN